MAVALDDLHAQRRTRVQNVSSLIRRKREEDVLRLHGFVHKARTELLRQLCETTQMERENNRVVKYQKL